MKQVMVPYEFHQEVDIHKEMRKARIRDCTARRCFASHANVFCDSDA